MRQRVCSSALSAFGSVLRSFFLEHTSRPSPRGQRLLPGTAPVGVVSDEGAAYRVNEAFRVQRLNVMHVRRRESKTQQRALVGGQQVLL